TSIPKLYLAGIIPGAALAGLFMLVVVGGCIFRPAWGGRKLEADWAARIASLVHLVPPLFIFLIVVGSIYAGLATPTEAAALGVVAALVLAWGSGRLSSRMLREVIENAMRTTAMIMLIILGAYFLNFVMSAIGLTSVL